MAYHVVIRDKKVDGRVVQIVTELYENGVRLTEFRDGLENPETLNDTQVRKFAIRKAVVWAQEQRTNTEFVEKRLNALPKEIGILQADLDDPNPMDLEA